MRTGTLFLYAGDECELLVLAYDEALVGISKEVLDGLSRLFVSEVLAGGGDEVRRGTLAKVVGFVGRLAEKVALAQGRGEVDAGVDPARAAWNLFALYYAELTAFLASDVPAEEAVEGPLREAIGLQLRGLLPREAGAEGARA